MSFPVLSIMLQLGLTGIFEGGVMTRSSTIVEEDLDRACVRLQAGETIYLRMARDNLDQVRARMAPLFVREVDDE